MLYAGGLDRGPHQPEIPGVEVGPDVELVAEVVGRVFQARLPRLDDRERRLRA